jgi:hypothetical protein
LLSRKFGSAAAALIFSGSQWLKMVRVATARVSAQMIYFHPIRDCPISQFPHSAMRPDVLSILAGPPIPALVNL